MCYYVYTRNNTAHIMFNVATRRKLVKHLRTPVRLHVLREIAEKRMRGTRYQSGPNFINALLDEDVIQEQTLEARNGKTISLYASHPLEEFSPYELVPSLFSKSYFCNLTAIYHHRLTNQVPNAVYVCHETIRANSGKPTGIPSESRVRSAFIKPHRHTNYVMNFREHDIVILDRERGSDHGVVKVLKGSSPCPAGSRVAGLERALIDAVVAPHYNGGITSLPAYFKSAHGNLKIEVLLRVYSRLRFMYPYAQSIGFFLEHAGMRKEADQVRNVYPPHHRFYVDHSAKESWSYNERWMILYPNGLIDED